MSFCIAEIDRLVHNSVIDISEGEAESLVEYFEKLFKNNL